MTSPKFDAKHAAILELQELWATRADRSELLRATGSTLTYSRGELRLIEDAIELGALERLVATPNLVGELEDLSEELRLASHSSQGFARSAIWTLAIIAGRIPLNQLNQEDELPEYPLPPGLLLQERIRTAYAGQEIKILTGDYEGPFCFERAVTLVADGKARLFSKNGSVIVSQASGCVLKNIYIEGNGDSPAVVGAESCEVILQDCFLEGNPGNVRAVGTGWHLPKDVQVVLDEEGNGRTFVELRVPEATRLELADIPGDVVPNELPAGGSTVCLEIRGCLFQSQLGSLLISVNERVAQEVPVGIRRRDLAASPYVSNSPDGHQYPVPLQLLPKGRNDVIKLAQELGMPTQYDEATVLSEILGTAPIKAQIRRREDRYDKCTVEFAIDPDSMTSKAGATLRRSRQCLLLSTNISMIGDRLNVDSPCLCWRVQRKGSGLLVPDGASRTWEGTFDCGGYGPLNHSLVEVIRSIEPPPPDQGLQLDAWNAFLEVELAEAEASQFYVYGSHAYAGGSQLRLRIDVTTACLGDSALAEPDFWSRLKAAIGQELAYSPDARIDPDDVYKLGTLDSVDQVKQIVTIQLTEENVEQLDSDAIELPSSIWVGYQALGDVSQIERKQFGLSQLEKGSTKNPRLGLFFFDAEKARLPERRILLSEHEMLLGTKVNPDQKTAVEKALSAPDLMLIQGPPGTGKTTVIAELCYQMAKQGKRCLVASQTNLAVDNALSRLEHHPAIRAIRAGNVSRLEEEGRRFSEGEVIRTWLGKTSMATQRRLRELRRRLSFVEQLLGSQAFLEALSKARAETKEADQELQSELDALRAVEAEASTELADVAFQIELLSNAVERVDEREVPEANVHLPSIAVDWSLEEPYIRALDTILRSLGQEPPRGISDVLRAGLEAQEWLKGQDMNAAESLAFDRHFPEVRDAFERCQAIRAEIHDAEQRHEALTKRLARVNADQLNLEDWKDAEAYLDSALSQLAQGLIEQKLLPSGEGLVPGLLEASAAQEETLAAFQRERGVLVELRSLRDELVAAESECAASKAALQAARVHNDKVADLERARSACVGAIGAWQTTHGTLTRNHIEAERGFEELWRNLQTSCAAAHQDANSTQDFELSELAPVADTALEGALQRVRHQSTAYLKGYAEVRRKALALREAVNKHVTEASKYRFVPKTSHTVPTAAEVEVQSNELARALRSWTERGFQSGIRRLLGRREAQQLEARVQSALGVCERYLATPEWSLDEVRNELHGIWKTAKDEALLEARTRLSRLEREIADKQVELRSIETQGRQLGSPKDTAPGEREVEQSSARHSKIQELIESSLGSSSDGTRRGLERSYSEWPQVIARLIDDLDTSSSLLVNLPSHHALMDMRSSCLGQLAKTTNSQLANANELLSEQTRSLEVESLRLSEARAAVRASLSEGLSSDCLWVEWRTAILAKAQSLEAQKASAEERRSLARDKSEAVVEQIDTLHRDRVALERQWEELRSNVPDSVLSVAPNRSVESPEVLLALFPKLGEERSRLEAVRQRDEKLLERWSERLNSLTDAEERELHDLYVSNANVVGITCVQAGAKHFKSKYGHFDLIIVDEVSKATPPELLLPSLMGDKIVLIGDTMQLPPLIGQETFKEVAARLMKSKVELAFVEQSLFKELWSQLQEDDERKHRLTVQYRMHPQICQAIQQFYNHKLSNGPDVSKRSHGMKTAPFLASRHFLWIDMPKAEPFFETKDGRSFANKSELRVIQDVLIRMNAATADSDTLKEVGIITFYAAQLRQIRKLVDELQPELPNLKIRTGTVDRFQGMERQVVLVSLVRNNPGRSVGFAERPERLNVALSRAQELLVVIGSQSHFSQAVECGSMYAEVANTARAYDGLVSGEGYSA